MTNTPLEEPAAEMSLLDHLSELRHRLLIVLVTFLSACCLSYVFAADIFNFLIMPLAAAMEDVGGTKRMIYTSLTEGFFTQIRVAAFGALCLSLPVLMTQLWLFIAPGLYKKEKTVILPFMIAAPILFLAGAALVYYGVVPMAWRFLLSFQSVMGETVIPIEMEARIGAYLSLMMTLILAFGFCFEIPLLLVLLVHAGFLKAVQLVAWRKGAIVAIFLLAAFLTPPDIVTQVGLALPLILLYEAGVICAKRIEKRKET